MGKTFVEDERPCDQCVNRTRYGCASWDCKFIDRDEAIKAWKEKHEMTDRKTEPTISKMEQVDKDINVRNKDCEACRHWKYIAHEWQCEACKCQGYEPKDEPQTEYPRCVINGTPFDECGFCEQFNCDTCKCEAQTERSE